MRCYQSTTPNKKYKHDIFTLGGMLGEVDNLTLYVEDSVVYYHMTKT